VVGITIPLVLAITFVAMYYCGMGLHKISLGSLIIALGLLVDDAIIAVEMMVRKLEEGYDKVRAATFAYEVTAMPMLTGTLITAAGFLPIGMAKSVTGEYTFAIFAVTAAAPGPDRWLVSVYFVPYLGACAAAHRAACRGTAARSCRTSASTRRSTTRFRRAVNWCVAAPLDHHRCDAAGASRSGIVGMGKVQQQFFPDSSRPEILVDLSGCPKELPLADNEAVAKRVEAPPDAGGRCGQRSAPGSALACRASTCRWTRSSRRPTCRSSSSCPRT